MPTDLDVIFTAFQRINELEMIYGDAIPWSTIKEGFEYSGSNVLLANQVQGIFKPKVMKEGVLSIKTTIPKGDNVNIYNDQFTDEGFYQYSLEQGDPYGERNVLLWQSFQGNSPFIYFHAVAPAVYKALYPCFVRNILPELGYSEIIVGSSLADAIVQDNIHVPDDIESRYMVRETKVRLHQASFREAVLSAYSYKCAITGLPTPKLLEAAHIIPDQLIGDKQTVSNGIALSRLHHKAYDANLIGIDPDYKIHISEELNVTNGGPLLERGILDFSGSKLVLPKNEAVLPNRDYLARRFETYKRYNN